MVRPGADRADDLVRFGRGEDKFDVLRRLFNDLQQRIETGCGHHMSLIDDEDLVPVAHRRKGGPLTQVAGVVDPAVAGGVDLNDVQGPGASGGEILAGVALSTWLTRRALRAVEAARQNSRRGGLSAASGTGEQIRV